MYGINNTGMMPIVPQLSPSQAAQNNNTLAANAQPFGGANNTPFTANPLNGASNQLGTIIDVIVKLVQLLQGSANQPTTANNQPVTNGQASPFGANGQPSGFGINGQPMAYGPNGQPSNIGINGQPVAYGPNGQTAPFTANGQPMILAPNGQPVSYGIQGQPVGFGPNGQPVGFGVNGQPMTFGPNGQPFTFTTDGQPVTFGPNGQALTFGPNGQPVTFGPNGEALTFSPNGQPIAFASNGQTLPFTPADQVSPFGQINTPNANPFAPLGNSESDVINMILTVITQLVQSMGQGNTGFNNPGYMANGQMGAFGPQGTIQNGYGINQNAIAGNNNGFINQQVAGAPQFPMNPAFNQPQMPMQPQISPEDQAAIDYVNGKDGQWLATHQNKIKQGDDWGFKDGPLKGYTARPTDGKNYEILNPEGQKIADHAGKAANKIASPVALDMNGDGKISTTGQTTAKDRLAGTELGETRQFDIDNNGTQDTVEWMTGNGDALLTDEQGKLFGDEAGKYNSGYEKLALRDADQDGKLTGQELNGLQLWADNGDAVQTADEMVSAKDAGVTSLSVNMNLEANARGENLMRSDAIVNGQNVVTEDVWFGKA